MKVTTVPENEPLDFTTFASKREAEFVLWMRGEGFVVERESSVDWVSWARRLWDAGYAHGWDAQLSHVDDFRARQAAWGEQRERLAREGRDA